MRRSALAAFGALAALWTGAAAAQVSIRFVAPERYTDAQNRFGSGLSLPVTLGEIRRILEGYGEGALRPGERLSIEVLDIDLAGFEEPGANFPFGLRVVRDVTPPRFRLRYTLSDKGRRLLTAEEAVTDPNFLLRSPRFSNGAFAYERDLLRDWLRRRIAERRPV